MFKKYIKHPLEFLIAVFFYLLFWTLPFNVSSYLCGFITKKIGMKLSISKRVDRDLKRIFPEKSLQERKKIIKKVWENLGRLVGELPHVYKIDFLNDPRIKIEGLEHVQNLLDQNKKIIFVTAHFGNWEMLGGLVSVISSKLLTVYRTANNPLTDRLICFARRNKKQRMIPKGSAGMRELVKGLKNNIKIAMLIDQKISTGITTSFLGYGAKTLTAHASLAHKFNAVIVPSRNIRLYNDPDGALFKIIFEKPIEINHTEDKDADIRQVVEKTNVVMENWIRKNPEQWFWLHNRWKK